MCNAELRCVLHSGMSKSTEAACISMPSCLRQQKQQSPIDMIDNNADVPGGMLQFYARLYHCLLHSAAHAFQEHRLHVKSMRLTSQGMG